MDFLYVKFIPIIFPLLNSLTGVTSFVKLQVLYYIALGEIYYGTTAINVVKYN